MRLTKLVAALLVCGAAAHADPIRQGERAYDSYRAGEQAETYALREEAFNKALTLYTELADEFESGPLYYNVANSYFQLREYPWAVLYYNRALELSPRDRKAQQNLAVANAKLGITPNTNASPFAALLYPHYNLSKRERWHLFSVCTIVGGLFGSLYIARRRRWQYLGAAGFGGAAVLLVVSIAATHFFAGLYGVMIQGSPLFRDAGIHYSKVGEPVRAGKRVEVLDVVEDGQWLRVRHGDSMGFVPADAIRIV